MTAGARRTVWAGVAMLVLAMSLVVGTAGPQPAPTRLDTTTDWSTP